MKHFYKKQIQLLLSGTSLLGFSKDGLIVFINSLCLFSKKRVLFVSEKESFNRGFYRQSLFFKSGFLFSLVAESLEGINTKILDIIDNIMRPSDAKKL